MEVKKGSLVVALIVLLSAVFAAFSFIPMDVRATILYVGGTGPGNYTTIQDAIDAADSGSTVFVYSGTYNENVRVYKTLNLIGEDRDSTIVNANEVDDVMLITADWVNVTGFTVENSGHGPWGYDAGIELDSVENCSITFNRGFDNWRSIYLVHANNSTVANNIVSNHAFGISLKHSNNNDLINNTISDGRWGILSDSSVNNTLTENVMVGSGIEVDGPDLEHWNTHTIDTSNTVNGNPVYYWKNANAGTVPAGAGQVILANCTEVLVENQNLNSGTVGISLGHSSRTTITNNTASSNSWIGLYSYASSDSTIMNNRFERNTEDGIWLRNSTYDTVANNTVSFNVRYGLSVSYSDRVTIADNDVNWTESFSISVHSTDDSSVINNTVLGGGWGIYLSYFGNGVVDGNAVLSSKRSGMNLWWSSFNSIFNNNILNNPQGLVLEWSASNKVHGNNFVDNAMQAYDDDSNQWDDGHPNGGNYWSDYDGIDNKRGVNQDQQGSDGLGDTAYVIDGDSRDRYPLMSPIDFAHPRPPENLDAFLSGEELENVTLVWALSLDDGMGFESAKAYEVFRNTTYDCEGSGYQLIATFPNGTGLFSDGSAGEGDAESYFYRICVVGMNNSTACAEIQAGKFTRPLSKGLNLISIPLVQSNESIQTVLQTVTYDNAWSYDSAGQEWKSHMKSKPYGVTLQNINHAMALWVNVTQDSNLTVAGVVPTSTTINLRAGWNLLGFPTVDTDCTVADLKLSVASDRVEGFDELASPYFLRAMADGDFLQAGYGYWIRVDTETVWTIGDT
ncbi:MAG: right-handed parallel beta-helix repeat-containing protein [Methanobacteriota archaeon]|nr:MAG: right-handed parallel beta-helix repeat-containing protein [Euryarchaeota archaeon]